MKKKNSTVGLSTFNLRPINLYFTQYKPFIFNFFKFQMQLQRNVVDGVVSITSGTGFV